jgi:hypothetical protein
LRNAYDHQVCTQFEQGTNYSPSAALANQPTHSGFSSSRLRYAADFKFAADTSLEGLEFKRKADRASENSKVKHHTRPEQTQLRGGSASVR